MYVCLRACVRMCVLVCMCFKQLVSILQMDVVVKKPPVKAAPDSDKV